MRLTILALAIMLVPACHEEPEPPDPSPSLADENAFRQLRQDLHLARTTGDLDLMRSLWADDAVLTTLDGTEIVGGDAIADFIASDPDFGRRLALTSESSWAVVMDGSTAEYVFETIGVDVGADDPRETALADEVGQNPAVEIVEHTHSSGVAARVAEGRWVFRELGSVPGPVSAAEMGGGGSAPAQDEPGLDDQLGFRRMRERFHLATITGDRALLRSVWADDAVFRGGGEEIFGGDAITDFMASSPSFGRILVVTPESSSRFVVDAGGNRAEYAFECISIDVGPNPDPLSVELCAPDGTQNPDVEIIRHTHTSGLVTRTADGRWVFQEFNGALGPLPPEEPGE